MRSIDKALCSSRFQSSCFAFASLFYFNDPSTHGTQVSQGTPVLGVLKRQPLCPLVEPVGGWPGTYIMNQQPPIGPVFPALKPVFAALKAPLTGLGLQASEASEQSQARQQRVCPLSSAWPLGRQTPADAPETPHGSPVSPHGHNSKGPAGGQAVHLPGAVGRQGQKQ